MTSKFSIDNKELLQRISSGEAIVGIDFGNLIVRELAAFRLSAMDSEPVAEVVSIYGDPEAFGEREIRALVGIQQMPYGTKLYLHAQPSPVVPDEAIWTCDPRKRGEFYTQEECNAWNACRAAILQAGNSPVIPESCSAQFGNFQHYWHSKGYVLVPNEPTEAMCDISHIGVDVYCGITDDNEYYSIGGAEAAKVWKAMLAAAPQAPGSEHATVPGKWIPVSERMPEIGDIVLTAMGGVVNVGEMECSAANYRFFTSVISGRELPATHWMPLPAAPQEVK